MSNPAKFADEVVFAYDVLMSYAKEGKKTTYKDLYNGADLCTRLSEA